MAISVRAEEETPPDTEWTIDTSASTISSGGWTFKYSTGNKVTKPDGTTEKGVYIGARTVIGTEAQLNFRTAVPLLEEATKQRVVGVNGMFYGSYGDPANVAIEKVWLPTTINTVGGNTFRNCANLCAIYPLMPDTVTSIGDYSYQGIPKLTGRIVISPNLKTVAASAFSGDSGIEEIVLGEKVKTVNGSAFANCSSVTNVVFNEGLETISGNAFDKMYAAAHAVNFLPTTVKSIGGYAFRGWPYAGTLSLGNEDNADVALALSGDGQFQQMSNLTKVKVGAGVAALVKNTFFGDKSIDEVEFFGFTDIGTTAFGGGNSQNSLPDYQARFLIPFNNTAWNNYLRTNAFVLPWDETKLADYQAKFGADAKTPVALLDTYFTTGTIHRRQYVVVKEGAAGAKPLNVTGETGEYGTVVPAYGSYDNVASQLPLACSAPDHVIGGYTRYACDGYVLSVSENDVWTSPVTNAEHSFTYNPTDEKLRQIKWLWRPVGYRANVIFEATLGTVESSTPGDDDAYPTGTTATFTATPAAGLSFGGWYGDVDDAQRMNQTISIVMDGEKTLVPYFVKEWEIAAGGNSMSDGYWTIPLEGKADALTVKHPTVFPILGIVDLRKRVVGGTITKIAEAFLYNGYNATPISSVTEVRLPETVTHIGGNSFRNLPNLKKITPLLPDAVAYIGAYAFAEDGKLEGPLTLGMDKNVAVSMDNAQSNGGSEFAYAHSIGSVTLGPGVTAVPRNFLNMANGINEIVLLGNVTTLNTGCFRAQKTIQTKAFKFSSFPTNVGDAPFQNWTDYQTCVYLPKGDASWDAWMKDPAEMTPWSQLSDSVKAKYEQNFPGGKTPKGLSVKTDNTAAGLIFHRQWIFTWRPNPIQGTTVIIR